MQDVVWCIQANTSDGIATLSVYLTKLKTVISENSLNSAPREPHNSRGAELSPPLARDSGSVGGQWGESGLYLLAPIFEEWRKREALAEVRHVLVGGEAGSVGG